MPTGSQLPEEFDPQSPGYFRSPLLKDPAPALTFLSSLLEGGGGNPALLNAVNSIRGGLQQRQTRSLADAARIGYFAEKSDPTLDPQKAGEQQVVHGRTGFGKLFESLGVVGPNTTPETMTPDEQYAAQIGADLAQKRAAAQLMQMFRLQHMLSQEQRQQEAQKSTERYREESLDLRRRGMGEAASRFEQMMGFRESEAARRDREWMADYDLRMKNYQATLDKIQETIRQHNQGADDAHIRQMSGSLKEISAGYSAHIKELQKQLSDPMLSSDPKEKKRISDQITEVQNLRSLVIRSMGTIVGLKLPDSAIKKITEDDDKPEAGGPPDPTGLFGDSQEAPPGPEIPTLKAH